MRFCDKEPYAHKPDQIIFGWFCLACYKKEVSELRSVLSALGVEKGPDGWTKPRYCEDCDLGGPIDRILITLPAERGEE